MSNQPYTSYRENMLGAGTRVDIDADDIRAVLVDSADYTFSAAHDFLDDVAGAGRVGTLSSGLTGKTTTAGTFDCNDFTFASVSGDQSEYLIFYDHTGGADSARALMVFFDTFTSGMPVTPNGGDINVTVNASGVFTVG
jgi:hypothetical protein